MPITQPVIWICQPPRSGGTLLLRLFDGHPQVHVRPMPLTFRNDVPWPKTPEVRTLKTTFTMQQFSRRGFVKRASNRAQGLVPIYFDRLWYKTIYSNSKIDNPRDVFNALATASFNAWRNYQNLYGAKKYVLFHTASALEGIKNFSQIYPDGHVIFIARNPLDWLASATKLRKSSRYEGDLDQALLDYISCYENVPESAIVIDFDKLILEPKNTLTRLCEYIGIEYWPTFETTTANSIPVSANSSHGGGQRYSPDPQIIGRGSYIRKHVELMPAFDQAQLLYYSLVNNI